VKSRKRRTRVIAGFVLLAASAAVASAMFGLAMAPSSTAASTSVSAGHLGQPRVAHGGAQLPVKLVVGPRKRTARAISATQGTSGPAIAAARVARVAVSSSKSPVSPRTWWLGYARTCSRTRGQPRTDALA
jgi:hypothetical protein